jgi:molybdate transport system ATP-binding protein
MPYALCESFVGSHKPFLTVDSITVRLRDRLILPDTAWQIRQDEHWAILGPNGSGKSTLVRSLWGGVPLRSGRIMYDFARRGSKTPSLPPKETIGYVSFEMHQSLMEQEALQEEIREYAGKKEEVTTGRDVVFSGVLAGRPLTGEDEQKAMEVAGLLGIQELLPRGITSLSTGEMRKTLIARALMKSPTLLILDEPFDGLDEKSRESLSTAINRLMTESMRVILVAHRLEEVVSHITHVLFIKNGRLFLKGPKEEMLTSENISSLYGCTLHVVRNNGRFGLAHEREKSAQATPGAIAGRPQLEAPETLIEMRNTTIRYGAFTALERLNWIMKKGENWAILGPNGSGKSTILKLILGDHLQGYANEIILFGRPKGSGETLWEIKKRIGMVSSELQVQYRKKMSAYDVIASGFYDSIGLYQYPSPDQKEAVDRWVELLRIEDITQEPFHHLSYGQRRMILLARAMVKSPLLLIVDEPCHGLDIPNRIRILEVLEKIGSTPTHLLYVTNHREEILTCISHVLQLERGKVVRQGRKDEVFN